MRHHGNYYNGLPEAERARAVKKGDCIDREGKLYLSLRKKREILLNNIFGVDIDSQAVEVAQLSLYLKLLEEETTGSARQYLLEFAHTAKLKKLLPDLGQNIVCGNSLIGWDIIKTEGYPYTRVLTLRPLDFAVAFRNTMKEGGFDALVGNPPYGAELGLPSQHYLRAKFGMEEGPGHVRAVPGASGAAGEGGRADFYDRSHRLVQRSEVRRVAAVHAPATRTLTRS